MNSLSHSTRLFIFIASLFIMPVDDTYGLPLDTPTYDLETDFYIVMSITLTFNILNLLGSFYIFYRTFLRWKYDYDKVLSLSIRLPFYIAITDFLVSTIILMDFSYSAPNLPKLLEGGIITWPSPYCELIGFFNAFTLLLNMLLVGAISFATWLRVVQEYHFDTGKYDYKIWVPIVFISFIIPLISIREFGAQKHWCGAKYHGSLLISALMFTAIVVTLLTIVICYTHVLMAIYNINDFSANSQINSIPQSDSVHHTTDIERKTLNKVLTYILVFLIQYIPLMISDICEFSKVDYVLIYALSPSAVSIGGLSNLVQYIYNEGLHPFRNSSSSDNHIDLESVQSNSSITNE